MGLPHLATVAPRLAVAAAVALAGLCVPCIAARTELSPDDVRDELGSITATRVEKQLPTIGPFDARCQRCEALAMVYRLR